MTGVWIALGVVALAVLIALAYWQIIVAEPDASEHGAACDIARHGVRAGVRDRTARLERSVAC